MRRNPHSFPKENPAERGGSCLSRVPTRVGWGGQILCWGLRNYLMMTHTLTSWMLWTDLGLHPRQPDLKRTQVAPSDPPQTSVRGSGWWGAT